MTSFFEANLRYPKPPPITCLFEKSDCIIDSCIKPIFYSLVTANRRGVSQIYGSRSFLQSAFAERISGDIADAEAIRKSPRKLAERQFPR